MLHAVVTRSYKGSAIRRLVYHLDFYTSDILQPPTLLHSVHNRVVAELGSCKAERNA